MKIGTPVECRYRGGNRTLGRRGWQLWVEDGRIGHGDPVLRAAIPLSDVASVDVTERVYEGPRIQAVIVPLMEVRRAAPAAVTDITVRTWDGQAARWVVRGHGADWVRDRLAPPLREALIPFYDELPPHERWV